LPAAVVSYAQCLKSHGLATTSPSGSAISAAQAACVSGKPAGDAANFRACLRSFGVTAHFNNSKTTAGANKDPHFPMASQACASLKKKAASS